MASSGVNGPQHARPGRARDAWQIAGLPSECLACQPGKCSSLNLQGRQTVQVGSVDAHRWQARLQALQEMLVESAATTDDQLFALFSIAFDVRYTSANSEFGQGI